MNTFLNILPWFGLGLVIPGLFCSFSASYNDLVYPGMTSSGVGYFVALCFGAIGAILAMVGGLISRPRFFWIACLIIGSIYILSFYGLFLVMLDSRWTERAGIAQTISGLILILLPGIILITEGIILGKRSIK
ncbi:MAG: hypothetical protein PHU70_08565 [Dehalococcoidia bacterium]|nr:hypothetical protein [Dehalococcoidia bacterium]MDD5647588.1 hypothetical protein [Dehalococcoidia bacterium]